MEITIETEDNKLIAHVDELDQYAILIPKFGDPIRCNIPDLLKALRQVAEEKRPGLETS